MFDELDPSYFQTFIGTLREQFNEIVAFAWEEGSKKININGEFSVDDSELHAPRKQVPSETAMSFIILQLVHGGNEGGARMRFMG